MYLCVFFLTCVSTSGKIIFFNCYFVNVFLWRIDCHRLPVLVVVVHVFQLVFVQRLPLLLFSFSIVSPFWQCVGCCFASCDLFLVVVFWSCIVGMWVSLSLIKCAHGKLNVVMRMDLLDLMELMRMIVVPVLKRVGVRPGSAQRWRRLFRDAFFSCGD